MNDYDFICVGGGLGGLAAAVRAADLGMSVLVLEKSPVVGGVAAYSGGAVWAPGNHFAKEAGLEDSRAAAEAYMDYVGGAGLPHDHELRAAFLDTIPEAIEYYTRQAGVGFRLCGIADQYWPRGEGSRKAARHVEATVEGVDLGNWLGLLRESVYNDPTFTVGEIAAAGGDAAKAAAMLGEAELCRRREKMHLGRGRGLCGAMLKAAIDRNIDIRVNARVGALAFENGRVTGLTAVIDGTSSNLSARHGVLLATGSYGDAAFAAQMEGLPEVHEQAPPVLDGDALSLIDPTPAAVVRAGFGSFSLGYCSAKDLHPGTDRPLYYPISPSIGRPHVIVVNRSARRFGDESAYGKFVHSVVSFDPIEKGFSNFPAFVIMDDRFRRNGYRLRKIAGFPESDLAQGATLGELALKLGLDADRLADTVLRFNGFCESGEDLDFHRGQSKATWAAGDAAYPNPNLGSLAEPPFWGVRLNILASGMYSHGLSIDRNGSVMTRQRVPIGGLYATGNVVAHVEMPNGYENGFANARNIAHAYNAATHAARNPAALNDGSRSGG